MSLSNEAIVLEAIRRCQREEKHKDGTIVKDCRPNSVFHNLHGWFKNEEKRTVFSNLLATEQIVLEFRRYKRRNTSKQERALHVEHGILPGFHPNACGHFNISQFYTSTRGRWLPWKRFNTIPRDLKFYEEFHCCGIYIAKYGVPDRVPMKSVATWA